MKKKYFLANWPLIEDKRKIEKSTENERCIKGVERRWLSKPYRIAILEADNRLVFFDPPTIYDLTRKPTCGIFDYISQFLYGNNVTRKRWRQPQTCAVPIQGPVYAANLLKQQYKGEAVEVTVYVPGISEMASSWDGINEIIKISDIVVVSSLTVHSWSQKEIIRMAKAQGKKTIATGAHVRMYEAAKGLLIMSMEDNPIYIPESRHKGYNDNMITFPGADYVIQHNHYEAFLKLVHLIKQGKDSPNTLNSIKGIGYHLSNGSIEGLTENHCDIIVPDVPDIVFDPMVIDGYNKKLKISSVMGSEQGCINACKFCQVKSFMRDNFIYITPGRLYENLTALKEAGLLYGHFNPLSGTMDNSIFFSDDNPVLGGELEKNLCFDYIEFSKILDYIGLLTKRKRNRIRNFPSLRMPKEVVTFLRIRNPAMLIRMKELGLSYTIAGNLTVRSTAALDLSNYSEAAVIRSLQLVVTTKMETPIVRPFAGSIARNTNLEREIRKNYVEFSKLLDEIERFERTYNCKPSFSIEMSVRAINFLQENNPYALKRMHELGFDMIQSGFEDILHDDPKGIAGIIKLKYEDSVEAIKTLKDAGLVILAMFICGSEIYELGDAKKTAEKALKMGIDCIQILSEQALEGTSSTRRHLRYRRCAHQLAVEIFDGPWRELLYGMQKGEVVTICPEKASMLGMQLDIIDAIIFFNNFSNHLAFLVDGYRKKSWRTALYGFGFSAIEQKAIARDLKEWLFYTPVRKGKSYVQLLAEIDYRWREEPFTLELIKRFKLEEMLLALKSSF